jgi:hypothetical protein
MEWFRHYDGLSTDPKLTLVGQLAGVHRCFAVAAWCYVLEHANKQMARNVSETLSDTQCNGDETFRGFCGNINSRLMAISLGIAPEEVSQLLDAMREVGMIANDRISAWNKRQFSSDDAYARVKRFREKARNVPDTDDETFQKRPRDRTEQNRKSRGATDSGKRVSAIDALEIDDELRALAKDQRRDPIAELQKFRDGCAAKGRTYKDYRAAFRNWLRSPYGRADEPAKQAVHVTEGYGYVPSN